MRVTSQRIFELAKAQTMAARQRVVHPGDDPAAAGIIIANRAAINRYDTIDGAVARASEETQVADGALQSVSTLLQRARELATQLGNDTYSATERAAGALEIDSIKGQIVQLMNTTVAGRYIFGGNVDRTPPFDAAGNYAGDTAVRQVEVAPGLLQNASVRADQIINGTGGGVDVFATLTSLSVALNGNDGANIRGSIAGLVSGGDQVASGLTQTGGTLAAFDSARSIGGVAKDSVQKILSSESEVDIYAAASELSAAQSALEATLAVSAKTFGVSLLDYLPR
jgi:flagellar hook-associated protein 3 FlgL